MVGTPGRLEDLISTGKLDLQAIRFFVLDECVSINLLLKVNLMLIFYEATIVRGKMDYCPPTILS